MTSPDERFDDAYLTREPPQHGIYDPERHEYRIGINCWPAECAHCGYGGNPKYELHICNMAIVDWVWNLPKSRDAGSVEKAYQQMAQIQELTEEEAAERIERRRQSEADFWNRTF